jgi:hypothetical protein
MRWGLYLKGHNVFVPTTGRLDQPVYRDMEPVEVVAVMNTEAVRRALFSAIARGNPPAPRYSPGNFPPAAVLKYAGVKTWSAFARGTLTWRIEENSGIYQIEGYRRNQKGYWEQDHGQKIIFPPQTTIDTVVDRMIAIVQNATRKV